MQEFDLKQDENILAVFKRSFPHSWHHQHNRQTARRSRTTDSPSKTVTQKGAHQSDEHLYKSDRTFPGNSSGPEKQEMEEVVEEGEDNLESLWDFVENHSVLDGCLVLTNKAIYECKPW